MILKIERLQINGIPALVWGPPSVHVWIAVHGNLSHKEDTVIRILAETAISRGYQVLSFDLPEHGDRPTGTISCSPDVCVPELRSILDYAASQWHSVSLFACSIGAYFSLLAYADERLRQCLFLSPVVAMQALIEGMMSTAGVTRERLAQEKKIAVPGGQTLSWAYYTYVIAHPISIWRTPTSILYAGNDGFTPYPVISDFSDRFGCTLSVMHDGEHFFHTPEQLAFYKQWLEVSIQPPVKAGGDKF